MYDQYAQTYPYPISPRCHCYWHYGLMQHEAQMNEQFRLSTRAPIELKDYGKQPFVVDIEDATEYNTAFRLSLWTGDHLQLTLMSLNVGEDIGLEVHHDHDQFLRIEKGRGRVEMGNTRDNLTYVRDVDDDDVILVPAGTWHNITNIGRKPLKLYSIYAPPEHPFGTVQQTKAGATT